MRYFITFFTLRHPFNAMVGKADQFGLIATHGKGYINRVEMIELILKDEKPGMDCIITGITELSKADWDEFTRQPKVEEDAESRDLQGCNQENVKECEA